MNQALTFTASYIRPSRTHISNILPQTRGCMGSKKLASVSATSALSTLPNLSMHMPTPSHVVAHGTVCKAVLYTLLAYKYCPFAMQHSASRRYICKGHDLGVRFSANSYSRWASSSSPATKQLLPRDGVVVYYIYSNEYFRACRS